MKNWRSITVPLSIQDRLKLRSGDKVLLSGYIFTGRDMAHQRLVKAIRKKRKLPLSLKDQLLYYVGPTPAPRGKIIGACGPTTSSRMDSFTPELLKIGLKAMLGKGERSPQVRTAIKRYRAVYFVTVGGAAALISKCVVEARVVAYPDLGPEAIFCLKIKALPAIVAIDSRGTDIFERK